MACVLFPEAYLTAEDEKNSASNDEGEINSASNDEDEKTGQAPI